jgi:hypothetical protein
MHTLVPFLLCVCGARGTIINRHSVVSRFNPSRNASSNTTPMQVGNGNFAFGADITGLQTFQPFAIISSWGWKNDSFPPGKTSEDIENYRGTSWLNHGRPVQYDFGGGGTVEQWLIANPNRVNLGRVGLLFWSAAGELQAVTEQNLTGAHQQLDMWTGILTSRFSYDGFPVIVETATADATSSVGIKITSSLLQSGRLGVFLDFPWNDGKAKFSAPFVGNWNATANHTTSLSVPVSGEVRARISHILETSSFLTSLVGDEIIIKRDTPTAHRYSIQPRKKVSSFAITVDFSGGGTVVPVTIPQPQSILTSSSMAWENFWTKSGFVDILTGSTDPRANELQRRIILSRYLMRVNEAGDTPPQEVRIPVIST